MKLTLNPPSSHLTPSTLHTHLIPPPKLPTNRQLPKLPPSFTKAKKALNEVGLGLPNLLAADKALWWQFAIEEVEWNLELEQAIVKLRDGTEEKWDLTTGGVTSKEVVMDTGEEEEDELMSQEPPKEPKPSSSSSSSFKSRWSPEIVLAQLHDFSLELRSAYEDITASSFVDSTVPRLSNEGDYQKLLSLSAEPALELPEEWTRGTSSYSHLVDENSLDRDVHDQSDERGELESQPRHGQFKSRRRPTRLSSFFDDDPFSTSSSPPRSHDYLSLVHLLTRIRTYLLDLLPLTIYPRLKENVGPNYTLWSIDGATSWCRRRAIERGREVGIIILELLEDEPEAILESNTLLSDDGDYELTSVESSEGFVEESEGEESWGIEIRESRGGGRGRKGEDSSDQWNDFLKMDKQRNDNPLDSMREDFGLRCWAEDAIERQRAFEREQCLRKPEKPFWLIEPEPWEVSMSLEQEESSDFDEPFRNVKTKLSTPFQLPRTLTATRFDSPSPSPRPPLTSPPRGDSPDDVTFLSLPELSPSASSSSSSDYDPVSDPSSEPESITNSNFFYPENYLGEDFLPKKLPKAVVTASSTRGKEMERARALLHAKLNEIAGLEKKMIELQEFSAEELGDYEESLDQQRQIKEKYSRSNSGLRSPGASSTSPPPTPRRKTTLPLKAQPLRHQTADNVLSGRIAQALENLQQPRGGSAARNRNSSTVLQNIFTSHEQHGGGKKRKVLSTPKPRKRQKVNLEALDKVTALERRIRRDSSTGRQGQGQGGGGGTGKRRGSSALSEKKAKANGGKVAVGGTKRLKKGKQLRREDSHLELEPITSPSRIPVSDATNHTPSAARLSLLELAQRRPPPPVVVQEDLPLPPSLAHDDTTMESSLSYVEVEEEEEIDEVFSSHSKTFAELEMEDELTDTDEEFEPVEIDLDDADFGGTRVVATPPAGSTFPRPTPSFDSSLPFPEPARQPSSIGTFPLSATRHEPSPPVQPVASSSAPNPPSTTLPKLVPSFPFSLPSFRRSPFAVPQIDTSPTTTSPFFRSGQSSSAPSSPMKLNGSVSKRSGLIAGAGVGANEASDSAEEGEGMDQDELEPKRA